MSTSSQSPPKPPSNPSPWHQTLKSHLSALPSSPEFVLSTLSHSSTSSNQSRGAQPQPRARYCILRGFWCDDLPIHESTLKSSIRDAGKEAKDVLNPSPGVYESEGLAFTTDVRMEKVGELDGDGGGGGDVEAVFWVKEVMAQWRVKGRAYVLGAGAGEKGEERARGAVKGWMRRRRSGEGGGQGEWEWEKEVTGYFANLSPVMRGSFKNPPPGTPKPKQAPKLGEPLHDLHDPIARKNFRVVVILPEVVEWVDLSSAEEAKRLRWTLTSSEEGEAKWEEVELWP